MKKNQNIFKLRVNKNSFSENLVFFKDYLISSNILNKDFSNLNIIYFEKDNFIEELFEQKLFCNTNYFHISKDNFKIVINKLNKDFFNSKNKLSIIILPEKITENKQNLESYQKKIIQRVKSRLKFIITNVPENDYLKKIPSWTKKIVEEKFVYSK